MPVLRETLAAYTEAKSAGWGGEDFSGVTHVVEERFGRKVSAAGSVMSRTSANQADAQRTESTPEAQWAPTSSPIRRAGLGRREVVEFLLASFAALFVTVSPIKVGGVLSRAQ